LSSPLVVFNFEYLQNMFCADYFQRDEVMDKVGDHGPAKCRYAD